MLATLTDRLSTRQRTTLIRAAGSADKMGMSRISTPRLMAGRDGALALVLAPSGALAARRGCAHANTPAVHATRAQIKRAVVCLIDRQRVERGLPALRANAHLSRSAQGWTRTMVATGEFTHGADFAARITQAGFAWSSAGENIATGFVTPAQVVDGWMASQGHCENILSPDFSQIGIGVVLRPVAHFAVTPATWTADFGLPSRAQAPSHNTGPMQGCPYKI